MRFARQIIDIFFNVFGVYSLVMHTTMSMLMFIFSGIYTSYDHTSTLTFVNYCPVT